MLLLVGAYTIDMGPDTPGKGRGISAYDFSPKTGTVTYRGTAPTVNPSYLATDAQRHMVYSVRECPHTDGAGVESFRVVRQQAGGAKVAFEKTGRTDLGGDHPCHLTRIGNTLLASCYSSGSLHVVGIDEEGAVADPLQTIDFEDGSPENHAHCTAYDPRRSRVYCCDLGADAVRVFDRKENGILEERKDLRIEITEGHGPRHAVLHPDGDHLLVNCEFRGRLCLIDLRAEAPKIVLDLPVLPERAVEGASGAALRLDGKGRNVYLSERNYSVVSTVRLDVQVPSLVTRDTYPSGGLRPRDVILSPDGQWLIAGNLRDHSLGVFRIGSGGGLKLHHVVRRVHSPAGFAWLPRL